jgi:hypothetical protein
LGKLLGCSVIELWLEWTKLGTNISPKMNKLMEPVTSFPSFLFLFIDNILCYMFVFIELMGFIRGLRFWVYVYMYVEFDLYGFLVLFSLCLPKGCFCIAMFSSL